MDNINFGRIISGGLVAGLIIIAGESLLNIVILEGEWEAAYAALGLPMNESTGMIVWYFLTGFILGIASIGLYSVYRETCGAGPKSAICAGLTVWFLTYFMGYSGMFFSGLFPMHLFWWGELWGVVEITLASLAGAAMYRVK